MFCFIGTGFFLHRHAAPFLTFRRFGSVPAVRKEKRMYFDAKEFGKRLHDVSTDYLLMGSEPSKEEVKNDLLSIISELSTIAKKI